MSFEMQFDSRDVAPNEQFDLWFEFHNGDVGKFLVEREKAWLAPFKSWTEGCKLGDIRFKRTNLDLPDDRLKVLHKKPSGEHSQAVFCLHVPIQGHYEYHWKRGDFNKTGHYGPGSLVMLDPASLGGHYAVRDRIESFLMVIPQSAMPDWMLEVVHKNGCIFLWPDHDLIKLSLYHQMLQSVSILRALADKPGSALAYTQGLLNFIEAAISPPKGQERKSGKGTVTLAQQDAHYQALILLIQANVSDKCLNANKAAGLLQVSQRYVHKLFAKHGTTFGDEVKRQRLLKVSEELADPRFRHDKIKDIADRYGFYDASPFNKLFKAEFKVTPSDYRRRFIRHQGDE